MGIKKADILGNQWLANKLSVDSQMTSLSIIDFKATIAAYFKIFL